MKKKKDDKENGDEKMQPEVVSESTSKSTKKWMSMFVKDEKNMIGSNVPPTEKIALKSPSLTYAFNGGFSRGYTTCLYGPEGSGKSLVSMIGIAALHASDPEALAVLVTTEMRPPEPHRLRALGVDPDRLIIRMANTLHDVFDWINSRDSSFTNSNGAKGGPGLQYVLMEGAPIKGLVVDSIKGIVGPKEQKSDSSETDIMGDLSKYLNPALRTTVDLIRRYKLMTIFVQQVNMNMNPDEVKYQNKKWTIPSGQSLKHFCESMALVERVTSKSSKLFSEELKGIRELPVQEGHTIRVFVDKDNLGIPFRDAEFRINYTKGVVQPGLEIALLASNLGVVYHPISETTGKPNPQMWAFREDTWRGFDNMVEDLENRPELQREIMSAVYDKSKGIN